MQWTWTEADTVRLRGYLASRGFSSSRFALRTIGDGHSNITTMVELDDRRLILRHQPTIRADAPDVLREARFIQRLNQAGVLAPQVLALAEAGEALDVPLYVMEHVDGIVISGDLPADFARHAPQMARAMIDGLADLHRVDAARVTSRPLVDPDANRRHFRTIRALLDPLAGAEGDALRAMADRLSASVPAAEPLRIVHSDYRLGNLMWRRDMPPCLATLLDWELATIGDPRLDLGYFMIAYPADPLPRTPLQQLGRALYQVDVPPMAELIDRYHARTGLSVADLGWFAAFVAWKTAVFYVLSRARGEDRYYDDDAHCRAFLTAADAYLGRPVAASVAFRG